jgi:hypothetical protein
MGAISYECSNTNVNDEIMKWKFSSNLPVVRNEAVYAQPQVPKRDVELRKRSPYHGQNESTGRC